MPIEDKFLKPAYPGLIIRDPMTLIPLSEKGELKPWYGSRYARYWRKQVNDGSVIIAEKEKQVKKVKESPPTQIQEEEVELRESNFKRRKKEDKE